MFLLRCCGVIGFKAFYFVSCGRGGVVCQPGGGGRALVQEVTWENMKKRKGIFVNLVANLPEFSFLKLPIEPRETREEF